MLFVFIHTGRAAPFDTEWLICQLNYWKRLIVIDNTCENQITAVYRNHFRSCQSGLWKYINNCPSQLCDVTLWLSLNISIYQVTCWEEQKYYSYQISLVYVLVMTWKSKEVGTITLYFMAQLDPIFWSFCTKIVLDFRSCWPLFHCS